jgi:putative ABC transport system permease protein
VIGVLRMAPWRRAPGLLLRRPGVAVALIAAAFVAALPASAAAPFLSSARSATLHHEVAASCLDFVGLDARSVLPFSASAPNQPPAPDVSTGVRARVAAVSEPARAVPGLGTAKITLYGSVTGPPTGPGQRGIRLNLMSRSGFADHVHVVSGGTGPGVWIPDQYARAGGLKVGDRLRLRDQAGSDDHAVELPVAAVYRDLRTLPDESYWCGLRTVYRGAPGSELANDPIPPVVLVDQDTFLATADRLGGSGTFVINFPLTDPLADTDRAKPTARGIGTVLAAARSSPAFALTGRAPGSGAVTATSQLPAFISHADQARAALLGTVAPITAAGVLVGLLVVAASALFWVQRRRRELTVLSAHGVSPAALGAKAVLETLPALGLGSLAGWAVAWGFVHWFGPDPVLTGEAGPLAALGALAVFVAGAVTVGVAATAGCRTLADQTRRRHHAVLRAVPWELAVLGAAPIVWSALGEPQPTGGAGAVANIPGRLLVIPIMVVAGTAVFGTRLATLWLRRRALARTPTSPAMFLGWRRVGREAGVAAVLAAATALPIALAAYGTTVNESVRATVEGKAKLATGSDVVITLVEPAPIPPALADHATAVYRINGALVGGLTTDVLAVDPTTFARDAYWTSALGEGSLKDMVAPLRGDGASAVGSAPLHGGDLAVSASNAPLLDRVAVSTVDTLPAEHGGYPVLIVRADQIDDTKVFGWYQIWARGDPDRIQHAAAAAHLPIRSIVLARDAYADSFLEPLTYTFDYLTALCLFIGLVTLVGVLLYLESRAPRHRRAYVLLRRMGLGVRSHGRALLVELGVPLVAGLLAGFALAAGLTAALMRGFDVNPIVPPATVLAVPYGPLVWIAVGVALIAAVAARYAQRRIVRANPAEVLRDTV